MTERARLWKTSIGPYKDQFGVSHDGTLVMEEVDVAIIERRPAKGMWSGKEFPGRAARAVDAGGNEYLCNWSGTFADDSPTPMSLWSDGWQAASSVRMFPAFYADGRKAISVPGRLGIEAAYSQKPNTDKGRAASAILVNARPVTPPEGNPGAET